MSSNEQELREAMLLFVKSLPADCFFNLVGFGTSFQPFFPNSRRYDDHNLDQAVQYVSGIKADLGGTAIFRPLEYIFGLPPIPSNS